jgi:hypothetical protein
MSEERPWTVTLGCVINFALAFFSILLAAADTEVNAAAVLLITVFTAIPVTFTLGAWFRRDWGRILLAVITGLPLLVFEVTGKAWSLSQVVFLVVDLTVIALLFLPASNQWYRPAAR